MRRANAFMFLAVVGAACGVLQAQKAPATAPASGSAAAWRDTFPVDKADLADEGKNQYFVLERGYRLHYKSGKDTLTITVLAETKVVDGVKTRIVEERETKDGELAEISRNYFAIDRKTGDVYYFGEDVDMYKGGKVTSHEGAWLAGVGGDRFGLMMPAAPKVGDKYYQEQAKVAKDRAEIVSLTAELKTPAGTFRNCLQTKESSAVESGGGEKWYSPGVGLVKDDEFVLVKIDQPAASATAPASGPANSPAAKAPNITDAKDKIILEKLVQHARQLARATTREKCQKQECPEMYCWVEFRELGVSLAAYELTGDANHLRDFAWGFENLRSLLSRGDGNFLGWRGKPIEPLRDPNKPDVVIDEIQTDFRAVGVISRFVELLRREPALQREFATLEKEYLDLMENHLVPKWAARGYFMDLGDRGAVYRWNAAYSPTKAHLTLAHEKQAIIIEGLLNLYRVTGRDEYMTKAVQLGAWLKRCMSLSDERYTWDYWDPAGPWDIHPQDGNKWKHWIGREPKGQWYNATVGTALLLYHHGVVFDRKDVDRFLKTQMKVCWNGDLENPVYANVEGKAQAAGERFASPALAPFDDKLAALIFSGKGQDERIEKAASPWYGGVLAAEWLVDKYVVLPAAHEGKPISGRFGEAFLKSKTNRDLVNRLAPEIAEPGWRVPLTPAQMK